MWDYIDILEEGLNCDEEFLYYLKEKVKLLNLYYSYIKTPWPTLLGENRHLINYSGHRAITNYCDLEKTDTVYNEKNYKLNYKVYGNQQFYFDICPFHTNTTKKLAFYIDNLENLFFCFGCGSRGNNFDFLQELYNLNLLEATKILGTIELWTSAESENNPFFLEQMKLIKVPESLTPKEKEIAIHLTRNWNYDSFTKNAENKREKLLQRVDNYIESQYDIGRLTPENTEDEDLLQRMSNRICVEKRLLKTRISRYNSYYEKNKIV